MKSTTIYMFSGLVTRNSPGQENGKNGFAVNDYEARIDFVSPIVTFET